MNIDQSSQVKSVRIGSGTNVWQYCVILENASIGADCNICSHCFIENDVVVGDRVTIKAGVQLWDGITIEDDVFIGPNVTFSNDRYPRSKSYPEEFDKIVVRKGASIGANATILPGITIGENAMVGAGAVVTKDVPAGFVVVGNPASMIRQIHSEEGVSDEKHTAALDCRLVGVGKVAVFEIPDFMDSRGGLSVVEVGKQVPFEIRRVFFVHDVPESEVRGCHAHKECHQYLICIVGSVSVTVDNGESRETVELDRPGQGLHLPPGIWGEQFNYSENAVLCVLASHGYDKGDYLDDYEEFKNWLTQRGDG